MVGNSAFSVGFQKGLAAYKSGDLATVLREWEPLAKQGNAYAQFNLGLMFTVGQGVPQDYKASVKWYTLAARQGDADAQGNLGFMYSEGKGVLQDYKTAVKCSHLLPNRGMPRPRIAWVRCMPSVKEY
jgi:TPR repeat protein